MSGRLGKGNDNLNMKAATMLLLLLSACTASGDGRFVGPLTTDQGACGLGFDDQGKATATLLLRGEAAKFAPTTGVLVLSGHVNGAGHVLAGNNTPGADRKPFPQVFEGERTGNQVVGRFATPRCRAAVTLTRR